MVEEKMSKSLQQLNKLPRNELAKRQTFNRIKYASAPKKFTPLKYVLAAFITIAAGLFIVYNISPVDEATSGNVVQIPIKQIELQMDEHQVKKILGEPTSIITDHHQNVWLYQQQTLAIYNPSDIYPDVQAIDNLANNRVNDYTYLYWDKTGHLVSIIYLTYNDQSKSIEQYSMLENNEVIEVAYAPSQFVEKTPATNIEKVKETLLQALSFEHLKRSIGEPTLLLQTYTGEYVYIYQFGAVKDLSFKNLSEEQQLEQLANGNIQAYLEVKLDENVAITESELYYQDAKTKDIVQYKVLPDKKVDEHILKSSK